MKGRAVSGMRQWILEPIFRFVICMIQSVPINQEQNKIEKKRKEKKDNRCRLAHQYRKEIRRLAQRRLRRCQRENRVMGQVCLNETILLRSCNNGWTGSATGAPFLLPGEADLGSDINRSGWKVADSSIGSGT